MPVAVTVSRSSHLAFHVPAEKSDEYRRRLEDKGVRVGPVLNHDESEMQVAATAHPGVYVRSFYFNDPDGITLEFACWTQEFTDGGTRTVPRTAGFRCRRDRRDDASFSPFSTRLWVWARGSVEEESRLIELPENRRELIDEFLRGQSDLPGQPYRQRLDDPADHKVCDCVYPTVAGHL